MWWRRRRFHLEFQCLWDSVFSVFFSKVWFELIQKTAIKNNTKKMELNKANRFTLRELFKAKDYGDTWYRRHYAVSKVTVLCLFHRFAGVLTVCPAVLMSHLALIHAEMLRCVHPGLCKKRRGRIIIIHFYFCFFEPAYSIPVHLCNVRIATSSIFSSGRKDVFFLFHHPAKCEILC